MTISTIGICLIVFLTAVIQTLILLFGFSVGFVTASTSLKEELQKKFQTGEFILKADLALNNNKDVTND